MAYSDRLQTNNTNLQACINKANALPDAGSEPKLQSKTVTPTTSSQTVNPDSGYDGLSEVTVNAMPTATQATPSITVSTGGLITAKSTQSAGYVVSGTKQATKQLTVQAAQTITPGTSNKTISSGRYLTGTQTIKGDANLKAENIKSGVSIFGVSGSYEGSGGGSGGGGVETCTVTITQEWGMNDDPELLHLYVPYYNAQSDGSIQTGYEYFTSASDLESQHSITFTAYKNVPINVIAITSSAGEIRFTISANGGSTVEREVAGGIYSGSFYSLIPTAATAIFTFSSP